MQNELHQFQVSSGRDWEIGNWKLNSQILQKFDKAPGGQVSSSRDSLPARRSLCAPIHDFTGHSCSGSWLTGWVRCDAGGGIRCAWFHASLHKMARKSVWRTWKVGRALEVPVSLTHQRDARA